MTSQKPRTQRSPRKAVTRLRPSDFKARPIWRFVHDDEPDETYVIPMNVRQVTQPSGRIIGSEVTLADGSRLWAMFGSVDRENPEATEQFITLSLFVEGRWFHLARYFDFDVKERGPKALAAVLKRPLAEVFPIHYDLRPFVRNAPPWLMGTIRASPRRRLTRSEIIALAVR